MTPQDAPTNNLTPGAPPPARARRRALIGGLVAAAAMTLAACGSDPAPISAPATEAAAAPDQTDSSSSGGEEVAAPSAIAVTAGTSPLGDILIGQDGMAVYGFTNDVDANSACYGTCAEAWPPLIVGPDWDVAPGLDSGIFNAVARDDGQLQLVAGKWPLYYFAGDVTPTDLNGQGSGDVWFVVGTDGLLITDDNGGNSSGDGADEVDEPAEAAPVVSVGSTEAGDILVDQAGLSLYGFLDDADGVPTCEGACADAWPPLIVPSADLPAGLDPSVFSVVQHPDGRFQLKAGKWPLYLFAGDAAPGDITGQGSGDVWFLSAPDGSLIGASPASADDSDDSDESEDSDY